MNEKLPQNTGCCEKPDGQPSGINIAPGPITESSPQDEVCCGSPPGPASYESEKPGYALLDFVEEFAETPVGPVPRVKTAFKWPDYAGTLRVRLGLNRDQYKIAPGLYCVGTPDSRAPVLVTANYKLTFDVLRKELTSISAWILVLDTRGINVWCAAGKDLFSTDEVVRRVKRAELEKVVTHKQLILPQLAATGVAAHHVKKESGFKVIWGPVRAKDIGSFLTNGLKAEKSMRQVTFSTRDRVVLIPVELAHLPKPSLWILLTAFLISGIGMHVFSFSAAWVRGIRCGNDPGSFALDTGKILCGQGRYFRNFNRRRNCDAVSKQFTSVWGFGTYPVHHRDQFLPGDEFYRIHSLYFALRRGKGNAQSHTAANGCPVAGHRCLGRVGFRRLVP
jgi:hypothetical protein